jgi:hypothetical protein
MQKPNIMNMGAIKSLKKTDKIININNKKFNKSKVIRDVLNLKILLSEINFEISYVLNTEFM